MKELSQTTAHTVRCGIKSEFNEGKTNAIQLFAPQIGLQMNSEQLETGSGANTVSLPGGFLLPTVHGKESCTGREVRVPLRRGCDCRSLTGPLSRMGRSCSARGAPLLEGVTVDHATSASSSAELVLE